MIRLSAPRSDAFKTFHQYCLLLLCCWLTACSYFPWRQSQSDPRARIKTVSFAILEDYDKGEDLNEVAKDFQLMKELGIDVLRCSLGWDDYEPVKGQYDFAWLKAFVSLALQHGIKLRPYIGYTPRWAAANASSDGMDWNNPPALSRMVRVRVQSRVHTP